MQHATSQTRPSKERRLRYTGYGSNQCKKFLRKLAQPVEPKALELQTVSRSWARWKNTKKKMPFGDKLGDPESD
ncbi:hypothetical protein KL937_003303 [Ogataea polymorpha]|nr:hypothetical protein KL937_003303 [Ogataea polymorpha]KAG7934150.1 hypothetical protein KL904_003484 [Ogataea polymorpha]